MSIKDQVSPDQWAMLLNAAGAASTFVSTASGGGLEMIGEVMNASKYAAKLSEQSGGSGYGELVDELLAAMKTMSMKDAQEHKIQYQSKDPAGIRAELKQYIADALVTASALPGADGYKRWLVDMARESAQAKTGGFLGIGAKSVVDEKEQAALDELAALTVG